MVRRLIFGLCLSIPLKTPVLGWPSDLGCSDFGPGLVPPAEARVPFLIWPLVFLVLAAPAIRRTSTAKDLADLISATASLFWPYLAIYTPKLV